jgi:hypothetical protein
MADLDAVECKVTATFCEQDILDTREDIITKEEATRFLEQNGKYIEEAMVRAGFEAVVDLWLDAA